MSFKSILKGENMNIKSMVRGLSTQEFNKIEKNNLSNISNNKNSDGKIKSQNKFDSFEISSDYKKSKSSEEEFQDICKLESTELKSTISEESLLNGEYIPEEGEVVITKEEVERAMLEFEKENKTPELLQSFQPEHTEEDAKFYDFKSLAGGDIVDYEAFLKNTEEVELKLKEELESKLINKDILNEYIGKCEELYGMLENFTLTSENITKIKELMEDINYYKETYGLKEHLVSVE